MEQVKRAGTNYQLMPHSYWGMIWINRVCLYYEYVYMCQLWCSDWYIMPRWRVWRFVSSQCQQLFCNGSNSRTII